LQHLSGGMGKGVLGQLKTSRLQAYLHRMVWRWVA
jgi:hypothetical protein